MKYRVVVCITLFLARPLFGCTWCTTSRGPLELLPGISLAQKMEQQAQEPTLQTPPLSNVAQYLPGTAFAERYLLPYYPKARCVVQDYFAHMCPRAVGQTLQTITNVLAHNTWVYFKNQPAPFTIGDYWESMLEQCYIIDEFLLFARVDPTTSTVVECTLMDLISGARNDCRRLIDCWRMQRMLDVYYDFYGFYFDYANRMFIEAIQFLLPDQAKRYQEKLEQIFKKLSGWRAEKTYERALQRSRELHTMLKQRLGLEK